MMNPADLKHHFFNYKNRELAYLDVGPRDGFPVIFFHGFPGSSYHSLPMHEYLEKHHLRLIAFDRPGYGASAPSTRKDYQYFINALEEFMDQQKIGDVYLLGLSGGAPYALAAAARWGNRVKKLAIVGGLNLMTRHRAKHLSDFQNQGLRVAKFFPTWQLEMAVNFLLSKHNPVEKLDSFLKKIDRKDRMKLARPKYKMVLEHSIYILKTYGPAGVIFDGKNYSRNWKVNLKDIKADTFIFHGENDKLLNHSMAQELASSIPGSHLEIFPNEGHFTLPVSRISDILETVLKSS